MSLLIWEKIEEDDSRYSHGLLLKVAAGSCWWNGLHWSHHSSPGRLLVHPWTRLSHCLLGLLGSSFQLRLSSSISWQPSVCGSGCSCLWRWRRCVASLAPPKAHHWLFSQWEIPDTSAPTAVPEVYCIHWWINRLRVLLVSLMRTVDSEYVSTTHCTGLLGAAAGDRSAGT